MKNETVSTRRSVLCAAFGAGLMASPWARSTEKPVRSLGQQALKVAHPTQAVLQAIAMAGGRRLVAAGERGLVIFSDDAGQSWIQARVPVTCTLTALSFADARRGWAVGNMGVVLATDDGGANWRKCLDGQIAAALALKAAQDSGHAAALDDARRLAEEGADKPFLGVTLGSDGSLFVVGAYGLAFTSRDGGQSWMSHMQQWPNPEGLSYYGMAQRRDEFWVFGEQGLLLKSAEPGADFTAQTLPSNGSLFGALSLRNGPLLLLGLRGKVWRSAGPGAAWDAVQTPVDASLIAGAQIDDGRAVLVGTAGQLLISDDSASRFKPLSLKQRFPFTGVAQSFDGSLLLTGMRGLIRLSASEVKSSIQTATVTSIAKPYAV